jgi:hypothetical protein
MDGGGGRDRVIRSSGHLVIGEPKPHPPEARRHGGAGDTEKNQGRKIGTRPETSTPGLNRLSPYFSGLTGGGGRAQRANRRHRTSSPTSGNRVTREGTQRERVIGEPKPHPPEAEARKHGEQPRSKDRNTSRSVTQRGTKP